jgi:hypothetical protein
MKNVITCFVLIVVMFNNVKAQISKTFTRQHKYNYVRNYNPFYAKENKVKSLEIMTQVTDSLNKDVVYHDIIFFDSLGNIMLYEEFNKNGKLKYTQVFVSDLTEIRNFDSIKKKEIRMYVNDINSINIKECKKSGVGFIVILNDSCISYFDIKRNRLQLKKYMIFDSFGNDKFLRFISDDIPTDTTDIFFDFDYTNKSFISYNYYNKIKIIVSAGVLNENNRIIKENFYWLPVSEFSVKSIDYIYPTEMVTYSIDQNGLIHQRVSITDLDGFKITITNNKLSSSEIDSNQEKAVTKMRYEYYNK